MKVFLKPLFLMLPLIAALSIMNGCHKEIFTTHGDLTFSADTLFDTSFTTLGSVTMGFTVRNTQSKSINVSDIKLLQLAGTQFRINVNGLPPSTSGVEYKNVDIPAHDSIYIFVEVTIQPNSNNNLFVIQDKIQFITNGNTQNVVLQAVGQNAHYYFNYQVLRNTTFTFPVDKPNIILSPNGGLAVFAVDTGATCIIPPGCKIFMGPNAVLTVDGKLMTSPVPTSWSDSTIFQYIRTDYAGLPGEWLGITYSRIATINLSHVIIDQSTFGISDEYVLDQIAQAQITTSNLKTYSSSQTPNVTLNNVIIRNASATAMQALATNLNATNCLFFSCSQSLMLVGMGGTYNLNNCTLANSYSQYTSSQNPVFSVEDRAFYLDNSQVGPYTTTVNVNNTIIAGNTGSNYNEVGFGLAQQSSDHISFTNCFLTAVSDSITAYGGTLTSCIDTAVEPQSLHPQLFMMPSSNNYMPDSASIVVNKGNTTSNDLYDQPRSPNPCIGAIQYHH